MQLRRVAGIVSALKLLREALKCLEVMFSYFSVFFAVEFLMTYSGKDDYFMSFFFCLDAIGLIKTVNHIVFEVYYVTLESCEL